ncbi:orotate phosphoribosyltransferase [Facklamia sp. DSM 111018]|uniref:Orotate phosphoribosyltransferase n=1 Tax=Facklamia lactis TaxID=2749967 RepID=A0ABS0LR03_9LACT|nr:orotate phosphoribosyltransferase [Facklamia lactis]MBG9986387.1 orotate phosphoribosyltransferase [Facklamia lactis]
MRNPEEELLAAEIAQDLLTIGAVKLQINPPFTWASGLKAPIYCDNRLIISYPKVRQKVIEAMVKIIETRFPQTELIAGTATAGIPHAAFLAQALNLPMIYVRSSQKDHGMENRIEGLLQEGKRVLMIEDLISTGGSVIQAADAVSYQGAQVIGVLSIFNYLLETGKQNFAQQRYPLFSLTDYQILIQEAVKLPEFKNQEETLRNWYLSPKDWSQNNPIQ